MPTALRVAEQRVGRVDRMGSPYREIEVWWPDDSSPFATRANDLLAARDEESSALLGSNLVIPRRAARLERLVQPEDFDNALTHGSAAWDGLRDALAPSH